jgi:uncharacterized protein YndB with AHSA1/START domain
MADFSNTSEVRINASPEAVFGLVGDLSRHKELHGSGELLATRILTDGPTAFGSKIEADESITMGGETMEFSTQSVVVGYTPNERISWIPNPPVPTKRIQWWFNLTPDGDGTKVSHEVEVDLGSAAEMFGGVEGYMKVRAPDVIAGMEKTLQNLKNALES